VTDPVSYGVLNDYPCDAGTIKYEDEEEGGIAPVWEGGGDLGPSLLGNLASHQLARDFTCWQGQWGAQQGTHIPVANATLGRSPQSPLMSSQQNGEDPRAKAAAEALAESACSAAAR
jgi:hypothetical protein